MHESNISTLSQLHPGEWIATALLLVLFVLRMAYLLLFYLRVASHKNRAEGDQEPLSLVLALRNEEENLRENLPGLLKIESARYEVVAVDDYSFDNSLVLLGAIRMEHPRLRFSSLNQETRYSEKIARNIALKAALYNWVMVIPPSITKWGTHWPGQISACISEQTGVVVNYSNLLPDGTFYNLLYRVEFFLQQLKSFGSILNGLSYIVTEENVAFKKQGYFEAGGFREKIAEPYAQLELVVNTFVRKKSTCLFLSGDTAFYKKERISKAEWLELLKKEISLIRYLPPLKKFFLVVADWIYPVFLLWSIFMLSLLPVFWPYIVTLMLIHMLGYSFIIKKAVNRVDESKIFLPSLLFAIVLPYFKLVFRLVYNYRRRKRRWKGKK